MAVTERVLSAAISRTEIAHPTLRPVARRRDNRVVFAIGAAGSQAPVVEQAAQRAMPAIDRAHAPKRQGRPVVRPGTAPAGR